MFFYHAVSFHIPLNNVYGYVKEQYVFVYFGKYLLFMINCFKNQAIKCASHRIFVNLVLHIYVQNNTFKLSFVLFSVTEKQGFFRQKVYFALLITYTCAEMCFI